MFDGQVSKQSQMTATISVANAIFVSHLQFETTIGSWEVGSGKFGFDNKQARYSLHWAVKHGQKCEPGVQVEATFFGF